MIIGLQHLSAFQVSVQAPTSVTSLTPVVPPSPIPPSVGSTPLAGGGYPGTSSIVRNPIDTTGLKGNAQLWFMFLPILTPFTALDSPQYTIAILDSNNFNDFIDNSVYVFRMEEIQPNRVPTVRRVILEYRDLGQCKVSCVVSGTNDNNEIVSNFKTQQIGNVTPTGTILTAFFDVVLTAFRPQVAFIRNAGNGPLSIISTTMIGEHEEVSL